MNKNIKYYHSWKAKYGASDSRQPGHTPEGVLLNLYPGHEYRPDGQLAEWPLKPAWLIWVRRIINIIACLAVLTSLLFGIAAHA